MDVYGVDIQTKKQSILRFWLMFHIYVSGKLQETKLWTPSQALPCPQGKGGPSKETWLHLSVHLPTQTNKYGNPIKQSAQPEQVLQIEENPLRSPDVAQRSLSDRLGARQSHWSSVIIPGSKDIKTVVFDDFYSLDVHSCLQHPHSSGRF